MAGKLALNPGAYYAVPHRWGDSHSPARHGFSLFMPFGSTMRVFHRFGMDSSLGFAVLAGLGAAAVLEQAKNKARQRIASSAP